MTAIRNRGDRGFRPNLLCIAPPYGSRPPAGSAYLLGYLKAHGVDSFDFLDLRLAAPFDFTPTYRTTGAFGESYVIDVPDLPLVLALIDAFDKGRPIVPVHSDLLEKFALERAISPVYLMEYLRALDRYLADSLDQLDHVRLVGFSVWAPNLLSTLMAAAHLKRRSRPPLVVAGGPHVTSSTASADLGLRSGLFDVVVLGEGEATLLEIAQRVDAGRSLANIPGTATLVDSAVVRDERPVLKLAALPVPSFDEMCLPAYQEVGPYRVAPLQLSRGCTDQCSFCSEWVFWKRFRSDDPARVVDHAEELHKRYGVNFIEFTDSLLNGVPSKLVALAEELLTRDFQIGWTAFMRAHIDPPTAELIARAGCHGVFVGIESFDDQTLAAMKKRRTEADNIRAISTFIEADINVTAGFIPGFPGDSREGFLHSICVVRELQERYPGRLGLHEEPFTVMANAPIEKQLVNHGLSAVPWASEYIDIAPDYADITSAVACWVEGPSQGLERVGRTRLVGAVKSDRAVPNVFIEGFDEDLSLLEWAILEAGRGWWMGLKKADAGHRVVLLFNREEVDEITAMESSWLSTAAVERRVARRHVIAPALDAPRVARLHFRRGADNVTGCRLTVPPWVAVRRTGSSSASRLVCADGATRRIEWLPGRDAVIFERLRNEAFDEAALARSPRVRSSFANRALGRRLAQLVDLGLLAVCDAPAGPTDPWAAPPERRLLPLAVTI